MTGSIREATAADIPAIWALDRESSPVYRHARSYERLLDPGGLLAVAELDGAFAGFAALTFAAGEATLLNLAVSGSARRRGVGRSLLRFAVARLVLRDQHRVFLEVRASNVGARALYRDCDFSEDGRRADYYPPAADGVREAAILMSRTLSPAPAVREGAGG